jgi:hypothetical protein
MRTPKFAVAVAFSAVLAAQTPTGTLQGVVKDPSEAVIPGVSILLRNADTNELSTLTTDGSGRYIQPFLRPGTYSITAVKPGFQSVRVENVKLDVGQNRSADVVLPVQSLATEVQVSAAPPALDLNTSSVGQVIENKRIMDLPLNGRSSFGLALLTPGVNPTGAGDAATPGMGGSRNGNSELQIDGVTAVAPQNNIGINEKIYEPQVDAVSEFSVQINSLSAEYGRFGGGVINVVTKSGTNRIHGTGYDYLRNSVLDANNFFSNRQGVPLASFKRNQWGGTIGGPIRRDKTFYFGGLEATNSRSGGQNFYTVPLESWKSGDFSGLAAGTGAPISLYDPLTAVADPTRPNRFVRSPFAGNRIPATRIDPVAANAVKFYPKPNTTPANLYTQSRNLFLTAAAPADIYKSDIRVDHNWSDKWRTFARVSTMWGKDGQANFWQSPATPNGDGLSDQGRRNLSIDNTIGLSPVLILNFRYGFGRFKRDRNPHGAGFDLASLGFPKEMVTAAGGNLIQFPNFAVDGVTGLGQPTFTALYQKEMVHSFTASLSRLYARHTVKIGGEYRKPMVNFAQYDSPSGNFSASAQITRRDTSDFSETQGFGLATFLLGNAGGYMSHSPAGAIASSYFAGYIQDDWKVTSRLTLNVGLRYEFDMPRTDRYDRLAFFKMDEPSPLAGKVPASACLACGALRGAMHFTDADNRRQTPADRNNVGPRFGFAYNAGRKFVVRGAYGIAYAPSPLQAAGISGGAGIVGFDSNSSSQVSLDSNVTMWSTLSNPFRSGYNFPYGKLYGAATDMGDAVSHTLFDAWRSPFIQQWNFNVQRELPGNFVVEVGYLGNRGLGLPDGDGGQSYNSITSQQMQLGDELRRQVPNPFFGLFPNSRANLNQQRTVQVLQLQRPFPHYTSVNSIRKPIASSRYHGLTARADKRFSRGVSMLVAYTAGKGMDDSASSVNFLGPVSGGRLDPYNRKLEWSLSSMDVAQRFVASFVYELPIGKGKMLLNHLPRGVNMLLTGWQANGIVTLQSGLPLIIGGAPGNINPGSTQRPISAGAPARINGGTTDERLARWFDIAQFLNPVDVYGAALAPFRYGNLGRVMPDLRAPGNRIADLSLFKNTYFGPEGRWNVQFRIEAFNAFNTPQFGGPNTNITARGAGGFGSISSAGQARQVQMALKLVF